MKLTTLIAAGLTATLLSTASYAQTAPSTPAEVQVLVKNEMAAQMPEVIALVEQLKAEGFTYIEIRRTLLGRAKIMAYGTDSMREVVMSSATGEIMRNVMREHDGSMAAGMGEMERRMGNADGMDGTEAGDMGREMQGAAEGAMGDAGEGMRDAGESMRDAAEGAMGAAGGAMGGMGRN